MSVRNTPHHRRVLPIPTKSKRRRRIVSAASSLIVEALEGRWLLSIPANLAGPPKVTQNTSADLVVTTTGTVAPSNVTIHDGTGASQQFTSFGTPPTVSDWHDGNYTTVGTYTPTASVTSGTTQTVPLTLDGNFASSGATPGMDVVSPPGADPAKNNSGEAMGVDPASGAIYVASTYNKTSTSSAFAVTKYHPDGSVDTSFGPSMTGTVVLAFDTGVDVPSSIFVDVANMDNCIMVAGNSSLHGWCIARLFADGTPDTNFGSLGMETNFHATGKCLANIVEEDGTNKGRPLLAGYDTDPVTHNTEMLVIRMTTAGAVDSSTFGNGGQRFINGFPSTTASHANTLVQDLNLSTNIYVGGWSSRPEGSCTACDFALASLDNTGTVLGSCAANFGDSAQTHPIRGCNGGGIVTTDSDYSILPWENTSTSKWYLYMIGSTTFSLGGFGVARFNSNLNIDSTWQAGGLQVGPGTAALAGVLQGSGDTDQNALIVAAGYGTGFWNNKDFYLDRWKLDGTADTLFGTGGSAFTDFAKTGTGGYQSGVDVALGVGWDSADGVLFAAGSSGPNSNGGFIAIGAYISNQLTVVAPGPLASASPQPTARPRALLTLATMPGTAASDSLLGDWLLPDPANHLKHARARHIGVPGTG